MADTKLCRDCKWSVERGLGAWFDCSNPKVAKRDVVSGKYELDCADAREQGGRCGPDAKHFEETPPLIPPAYLDAIPWDGPRMKVFYGFCLGLALITLARCMGTPG